MLILDTETLPHQVGDTILHTLALWHARAIYRHGRRKDGPTSEEYSGETAEGIVALVERLATTKETLWVFTHNLSFDLAVTRLPVLLIERGWELTQHALASDAPWARLRNGTRRVTLANSASYLPASLASIGAAIGIPKPPLPPATDLEALRERCRADVEITAEAMIELMNWWDDEALGNWSLTGPATGWGAYRHIPMGMKILITPDPEAQAFERSALLAGRREAFRVGQRPDGFYLDLDIEHAHLTACATQALPYQRMQAFDSLPLDSPWLRASSLDVMAEATIDAMTPRYPVMMEHGIFYPVGRFKTVLAGPELREALARGELAAIGRGYLYRVGAHMARWGAWMLDLLDGSECRGLNAVAIAVKGWSRSVPGRWASRTSELLTEYEDHRPGWWLEHGAWGPERWPVSYLTVGGHQYVLRRDVEGENSFPAVLAWVQSYTRVWLGRLIDLAGPAAEQCNTDGLIVDANRLASRYGHTLKGRSAAAAGAERQLAAVLEALNSAIAPARVRVKRTSYTLRVIGPQHVILDGEQRLSGVPRDAARIADLRFRYWSWPTLQGQLLEGDAAGFRQHEQRADLSGVTGNRYVLEDGTTRPPVAHIDHEGATAFMPWQMVRATGSDLAADRAQHRDLPIGWTAQPALT